jgi:tetratricopeptide (TPR) repeat protein
VLLARARLSSIRQSQRYVADLEAALALFRACDDPCGTAVCLAHLADAEAWLGDLDRAGVLMDEAVRVAEHAHDEETVAFVRAYRALAATGYEDAAQHARAAIERLRPLGDLFGVADVCTWTGYLAIVERRYHDALAWCAEGLDAGRSLGHPAFVFLLRGNQGLAALFLGEVDAAAQAFCDALVVCREAGSEDIYGETLLGVAAVAARDGDLARAARLAGAAKAHETGGRSRGEAAIWARLNDEVLAESRERYGVQEWGRAEREGAGLTVPETIDLALSRGRFATTAPAN